MHEIKAGLTDQSIDLFVLDSSSTTGAGLTGLTYNAAGLTCYYRRGATGTLTALTLASQTVGGAHADGGFVEIDATNAPGLYRLDLADAIIAAGVDRATLYLHGAANMAPVVAGIRLPTKRVGDLNDVSGADVNAQCDQALADYDGPTHAELIAALDALANFDPAADALEGAVTYAQALRIVLAFAAGKTTGADGSSPAFRDQADTKNRIAATLDASGNRTAVTLDGS